MAATALEHLRALTKDVVADGEYGCCLYCYKRGDASADPATHEPTCVWVAARRFLDEQEVG